MIFHFVDFLQQILPVGNTINTPLGTRGAILLDAEIRWVDRGGTPFAIWALLADQATGQSIIGQLDIANDFVVIEANGVWTWTNPLRGEILSAAAVIEKMALTEPISRSIPGAIQGQFRQIYSMQQNPVATAQHGVQFQGNFLVFDSSQF